MSCLWRWFELARVMHSSHVFHPAAKASLCKKKYTTLVIFELCFQTKRLFFFCFSCFFQHLRRRRKPKIWTYFSRQDNLFWIFSLLGALSHQLDGCFDYDFVFHLVIVVLSNKTESFCSEIYPKVGIILDILETFWCASTQRRQGMLISFTQQCSV